MPFDGEEFGRNIVAAVNASIERSINPLIKRLDALEAIGIPRNGKDADPIDMDAVRAMIVEECKDVRAGLESTIGPEMQTAVSVMVAEAVKAIPVPAAPELPDIAGMVDQAVSKAVEAIPAPKDGKDADPIDMDAVKAIIIEAMPAAPELPDIAGMVDQAVSKAVEAIPVPAALELPDIAGMVDTAVSKAVEAIPAPTNGKDGVDAVDCLIDKNGHLWFTFSNGRTKDVGQVVGDDGVDCDFDGVWKLINAKLDSWPKPKDGVDGMGFDDLSMEYDGERTFKFVMVSGDRRKEYEFSMPVVLDRGVYSEGKSYAKGDSVTFGGSTWIAQVDDATEKPGTTGKQWRLSVKRGSPGKDGTLLVPRENKPVKIGV